MALTPASPQRGRPKPPLIDEWSIREKLALASSVSKSGDQNWHSTSRPLRVFAEGNRPNDWFSQKNCALQYEDMLEKVEQPKRKRGERGEETAQDVIVRELTRKRIEECRKLIQQGNQNLRKLRIERQLLDSDQPPPELLKQIWQRKLDEEAEAKASVVRHQEWLKEREVKILNAKIATRSGLIRARQPVAAAAPVPAPIPPAIVIKVEPVPQPAPAEAHDESSIQSATDSTAPTTPVSQNPPLTSPLLTSLLQSPAGPTAPAKETTATPSKSGTGSVFFVTKPNTALSAARALSATSQSAPATPSPSSPVKGGTDETSQTPSASPTLSKLLELPLSSASANKLPPLPGSEKAEEEDSVPEASEKSGPEEVVVISEDTQPEDSFDATLESVKTEAKDDDRSDDQGRGDGKADEQQESKTPVTRRQRELRGRPAATPATPVPVVKVEATPATQTLTPAVGAVTPANAAASSSASVTTRRSGRIRGNRDVSESESSLPEKKPSLTEDPNLMDVSASEESLDAAPRLNIPSKAPSISDSIPNSPASTMHSEDTEPERDRKRWQKSVAGLLKLAMTHRDASVFLHPAVKEVGKDYQEAIKRPVDLTSIKKRVENQSLPNAIRTTAEFQREMMLLFQNALMYNKKGHDVHEIALEMRKEILEAIDEFVQSEKQIAAAGPPPPTTGGKTGSTCETPAATKQRNRDRRTPAASVQAHDDAASRRRSRTSTDTDPGTGSASVPLTRTALKKKATS